MEGGGEKQKERVMFLYSEKRILDRVLAQGKINPPVTGKREE